MRVDLQLPATARAGSSFQARVVVMEGNAGDDCELIVLRTRPRPTAQVSRSITLSEQGDGAASFTVEVAESGVAVFVATAETSVDYDSDGEAVDVT